MVPGATPNYLISISNTPPQIGRCAACLLVCATAHHEPVPTVWIAECGSDTPGGAGPALGGKTVGAQKGVPDTCGLCGSERALMYSTSTPPIHDAEIPARLSSCKLWRY